MLSQIRLRLHYPIDVQIAVDEQPHPQSSSVTVTPTVHLAHKADDTRDWRVQLQLKFISGAESAPLVKGDITYVGYFVAGLEIPENEIMKRVGVHGTSLLYGSIRELVLGITSRIPKRSVILPALSFSDLKLGTVPLESCSPPPTDSGHTLPPSS